MNTPTFTDTPSGRFFIKMHGLRNHFVIVDARNEPYQPSDEEIVRICNLETGVGGDQLIVIEPSSRKNVSAFMRIFNVDAREVEACGNATRCVAWLLLEEFGMDELRLETRAGLIECRRTGDQEVSCGMGKISMDWKDIPLAEERDTCYLELNFGPLADAVALNIGNPHIVYFVDDIDSVDIELLAPAVQRHELFPDQVNVGIAQILNNDHIRSIVYERGAGLTTACGSGACVAAFAALARGLTDRRQITVSMPAGDVIIEIGENDTATMTGPVAYSFSGFL